ncbi:retinoic acid receptor responder protein 1 [Sminthopsis crassicaudata]|uniref:retinoic acid receptor responder protein 1 n=1 Tax=Sminthopsis crassicaudata TaxID=9301 RepID=UPI003D699CEB
MLGLPRPPARLGPTAVLLVALLPAVARASWEVWWPLEPSSPQLQQAARAALHFFNYRAASPSTARLLKEVLDGSSMLGENSKTFKVEFSVESYRTKLQLGTCSARVVFKNNKFGPTVNVTCTQLLDKKEREQEDYKVYKQIKQQEIPPLGTKIPDKHGDVDPSLQPLWELAMIGNSFLMWEKTSSSLYYYVQQITDIKKWISAEDFIILHYTVLLHEFSTQNIISCHMHLIWYPGKTPKIQYHCQDSGTGESGSGNSEGSAERSL